MAKECRNGPRGGAVGAVSELEFASGNPVYRMSQCWLTRVDSPKL